MGADRMPASVDPALSHVCPHVDRNDARCQQRFRMGELDSMYRYCLGGYYGCVLFHRLNREATHGSVASRAAQPQPVTLHGNALGVRRARP